MNDHAAIPEISGFCHIGHHALCAQHIHRNPDERCDCDCHQPHQAQRGAA